jgi:hypothetical protein
MEAQTEQAYAGSWSIFSIVSAAMMLIALIVTIFSIQTTVEASMVRVTNGTGLPLQNVRVNSIFFGDVPVDGVSGYKALTPAYRYAALRLSVEGKKFEMIPDDQQGEAPLGRGSFTYRILRQDHNGDMYFITQDATRDQRFE